jgi:hypothetical protein
MISDCHIPACSTIFAEAPLAPGAAEGGPATYMSRAAADQLNEPQHMNNYTRPNGQNVCCLPFCVIS